MSIDHVLAVVPVRRALLRDVSDLDLSYRAPVRAAPVRGRSAVQPFPSRSWTRCRSDVDEAVVARHGSLSRML